MKEDRLYNVRMSFNHGNAITLDLKGCGSLYIKPGKEYYFINCPINFINYLTQLRRLGITYAMTNNKRGCYQEVDLTHYNLTDPRYIISSLRKTTIQEVPKEKPIEVEDLSVVLSSEDNITEVKPTVVKEAVVEEPIIENQIEEDIPQEEIPSIDEVEEIKEEPKVEELPIYREVELTRMGKVKLLEIAHALGLEDMSDINTKKEIREAILEAQK